MHHPPGTRRREEVTRKSLPHAADAARLKLAGIEVRHLPQTRAGVSCRLDIADSSEPDVTLPRSWAPQGSVSSAFDQLTSVPIRTKLAAHRADRREGIHATSGAIAQHDIQVGHVDLGAARGAISPTRHRLPRPPCDGVVQLQSPSPRARRHVLGGKTGQAVAADVRSMDRAGKLEAVSRLHEMARNLHRMRAALGLLSASAPPELNIKTIRIALEKAVPQLKHCFVLQALGPRGEYPSVYGPAQVYDAGALRLALSQRAHGVPLLAALRGILSRATLQEIGVTEDQAPFRVIPLQGQMRITPGLLACVAVRDRLGRPEAFICGAFDRDVDAGLDETFLALAFRSAAAHLSLIAREIRVPRGVQTDLDAAAMQRLATDEVCCQVRQRIGANADLWRVSMLLRNALKESIRGCLDCVIIFRDDSREEGFVLLEAVPLDGPKYASDGAVRVVLDDRTDPETDVLLPCAQIRAKLRVYERTQCAALKCLRTGRGPLVDPAETPVPDLVRFAGDDLCASIHKRTRLAQTCVPVPAGKAHLPAFAALCVLSDQALEAHEVAKLQAVAIGVASALESAHLLFDIRRARLAASIELQTSIDTRRDERAAQQALTDMILGGVCDEDSSRLHEHLNECAEECLATQTRPRMWLREDCARILQGSQEEASTLPKASTLVAISEDDPSEFEKREFGMEFFEPIVLEDAVRVLVPLVTRPEQEFLGLIETASPLLRSLDASHKTNLHSAGGIVAKRWIVHSMHFAEVAADFLRSALAREHVESIGRNLVPPMTAMRGRLREAAASKDRQGLLPKCTDFCRGEMAGPMRYFTELTRALMNAAGVTAFGFDNTVDPTHLLQMHNTGLDHNLLVNPDALYLQRRLGSSLVLQAMDLQVASSLVFDDDFDGDLLGSAHSKWGNEDPRDISETERTIRNFTFPGQAKGRDKLTDELLQLRIKSTIDVEDDDSDTSRTSESTQSPQGGNESNSQGTSGQSSPQQLADAPHASLERAIVNKESAAEEDDQTSASFIGDEEEFGIANEETREQFASSAEEDTFDTLVCGMEHQCTRFRPSVSIKIRQTEIEADMALRQRRYWTARAGTILQVSKYRRQRGERPAVWSEAMRWVDTRTESFTSGEVFLVESIMAQASALWHNLWRYEDVLSQCSQAADVFSALGTVASIRPSLAPASGVGSALFQFAGRLRHLLSCDRVTIHAVMPNLDTFAIVPVAQTGCRHSPTALTSTHSGRFLIDANSKENVARAVRHESCLVTSALHESDQGKIFSPRSEPSEGGRAYTVWSELCIPVRDLGAGRIVGVIQACNRLPKARETGVVAEPHVEASLDWVESVESFTDLDVDLLRHSGLLVLLASVLSAVDPAQLHARAAQICKEGRGVSLATSMASVCSKQVVLSRAKESFLKGILRAKLRMERRRQSQESFSQRQSKMRRRSSMTRGKGLQRQDSSSSVASSESKAQDNQKCQVLDEEEKHRLRMAKLKEETIDGDVPDARKFVRMAVKRFIEDEALRQDRERQTVLHRRKENRDWATMMVDTEVQTRLHAPELGPDGKRRSIKVSRRSGIRYSSFTVHRHKQGVGAGNGATPDNEDDNVQSAVRRMQGLMAEDGQL